MTEAADQQEHVLEPAMYQIAELARLATSQATFIEFIDSELVVTQRKQTLLVRKLEELHQERLRLAPGLIHWMEPFGELFTETRIRLARIQQMEATIVTRLGHLSRDTYHLNRKRRDLHLEGILLREEIEEVRRKSSGSTNAEAAAAHGLAV